LPLTLLFVHSLRIPHVGSPAVACGRRGSPSRWYLSLHLTLSRPFPTFRLPVGHLPTRVSLSSSLMPSPDRLVAEPARVAPDDRLLLASSCDKPPSLPLPSPRPEKVLADGDVPSMNLALPCRFALRRRP